MAREYKDSGIEWIGQIPKEWSTERIKTIFSERSELSDSGSEELLSVSEYYGVASRKEKIDDGEFVSRAESLVGYKKCFKGDLVSNIMLAWKGSLGVTNTDGIVSPAYCVYKPSSRIYPEYYHYLFRTSLYTSIFRLYSKGIIDSRLRLYSPYFFGITTLIPSLSEQQKIATYLDKVCGEVDEMIALQEQMIEELKAYKQSVITEAVTKGLNPDVPMKDSGIDWIGEIPEHWDVKKVKYIADNISKGNGITKEEVFIDGDVPCVRYGEIYSKYNGAFTQCFSLTKREIIQTPRYFYKGNLLFAGTGELVEEIGKNIVYLGEIPCLAGGDIIILAHYQEPSFLNYALNSFYAQTQKSRGKAKLKVVHISASEIGSIRVLLPPLFEQSSIASFLDAKCSDIDSLIAIKQQKIEELKEYKKSVIYEYVTGKKEVV